MLLAVICPVSYARKPSTLPPTDPSLGRVVIYRPWHYVGSATGLMVALNGQLVGMCRAGKYFYADMKPGLYFMQVYYLSLGSMGNVAKQTFALHAGQTAYVKLDTGFANSIEMVSEDQGGKDLVHVRFDSSAVAKKNTQSEKHVEKARLDYEQYRQSSGIDTGWAQPAAPAGAVVQPAAQQSSPHGSIFSPVNSGSGSSRAATMASSASSGSTPAIYAAAAPGAVQASVSAAGGTPVASGANVALVMGAHCPKDPDPLGLVNENYYSGCKPKELNQVRGWIAADLTPHGLHVTDANAGYDYQFSVTIIKDMDKLPVFTLFGHGTVMFEATYQVLDAAGHVLHSGNVAYQGPDSHPENVEKQFAQKIADALSTAPVVVPAAAPAVSAGIPGGPAAASSADTVAANSPLAMASDDNLYEIVAQAYRSLAVKPPLSDNARAENFKAEDLMAAGNFKGAATVYRAILATDRWWPEGYRGLALALGQTGDAAGAIVWMHRYLAFVPSAPDAAEMQAKVDTWVRQAPPAPEPSGFTVPPGPHLGVVCGDTPGIVATALGQPDLDGALITLVLSGSAAESAGLRKGDIVVSYDGAPVRSAQELLSSVAKATPGATAKLVIQRGSARSTVVVLYPGAAPPAVSTRMGK